MFSNRERTCVKQFWGWLLVVSLAMLAVLAVLHTGRVERNSGEQALQARLQGRSLANADVLTRRLEDLRRDALFLRSVPPVDGVMRASANGGYDAAEATPGTLWEKRLTSIFRSYLEAHPDVFQVRLIGSANNGRELIRVEREPEGIIAVPPQRLQDKGDTAYVQDGLRLRPDQAFISDLNLNREHGKIQLPEVPTVRAVAPVFGLDGKIFGLVVINYDLRGILRALSNNLPPYFNAYLMNSEGDFLLHPDVQRSFGFERGQRWRWGNEFRRTDTVSVGDVMERLQGQGEDYFAIARKISLDPLQRQRDLTFVLTMPQEQVYGDVRRSQRNIALALGAGALIMGAAFFWQARQQRVAREYQSRVSAIVESSHDAIIGKTLDGVVTSWNHGAERMFGYTAEEAVGQPLMALIVPPGSEAEEEAILRKVLAGDGVDDLATQRRRKDGSMLDVLVTSSPIRSAGGRIVGAAKTVRDISERVAAERHIRDLNANLECQVGARTAQVQAISILQRAILEHSAYAIIATDEHGIVTLFNPAAEHMLGYQADELVAKESPAIWHDPDEVAARALVLSAELGRSVAPGFEVFVARTHLGGSDESSWTYVRKDGSKFPVLLSVSALRADDGSINGYLGIAADISLQEQQRRSLEASRTQLLHAAAVAELGIWTWDVPSGTMDWNDLMCEIYEVPLAERGADLNYEHWRSRLHPDDVERAVDQLNGALEGRCKYDLVFRICDTQGQVRQIQASAMVERDASGKALRMVGINRDITAQHQAEAALLSAVAAADAANRAKSAFLANMSHEIRSPMNAVLGMLALLKRTTLNSQQYDYANKAEGAGRALLGILNDILDFSRVEAGKLTLDPQPFSVDQLMRDIGVILSANVGDKNIELVFDMDPRLPEWLQADALRLQQILINLAGNAVKFTQQGEVVLRAHLLPALSEAVTVHDEGGLRLGFSVSDTGIGISEEQCQRIFEGFTQAEVSTVRRFGGSGLGLAISQRLVEMMEGQLRVESQLGVGSTFSFDIACQSAAAPDGVPIMSASQFPHFRCLVVDDHAAARESMQVMLRGFGWEVDMVDSGEAALARCADPASGSYDAVFMDWQLGGINGWEASAELRRRLPPERMTLIIMVTAHGQTVLVQREAALPAVVDGIVVKPVTPSLLLDAVAEAYAAKQGGRRSDGLVAVRMQPLAGRRLLLVEDNPINQQVARELLTDVGASVEVAGDGHTALQMLRTAQPMFDCVLMDIQMPGIDGYTTAREIRASLGLWALPIIAMTANVMESDRHAAMAAGMNDHIGKPFDIEKLAMVILRWTDDEPETPVLAAQAPALDALLDRPGFDGNAALSRFGGNQAAYSRALRHFSAEIQTLVAAVPALPLESQRQAAGMTIHSLKGLAGTVGATELAHQAHALEQILHSEDSLPRWGDVHTALLLAGRNAQVDSLALAQQIDSTAQPPKAPSTADPSQLPLKLQQLRPLLAASNLDALPMFEALVREHRLTQRPEFLELTTAIDQFNFALAVQECDAILDCHGKINASV
ncbi:PAS domain S-box protein [Duganella sp. FT80W]|uniref:Virulence sensor protein BvgS n=1 Tax=Duganella guangzhouensis TaxID=2666084 RepID=A0A6I2LDK9_9BURK|nr:PAS domain S-box protein [Duganella guangzhouensis]MRW94856.1 PAS domain S-box protein [Duganella guangzhouensis]